MAKTVPSMAHAAHTTHPRPLPPPTPQHTTLPPPAGMYLTARFPHTPPLDMDRGGRLWADSLLLGHEENMT